MCHFLKAGVGGHKCTCLQGEREPGKASEAGEECSRISVQDGGVQDAGEAEGVLIMAIPHHHQQIEPGRQGRGLLGETLSRMSPDHSPCTASHPERTEKCDLEDGVNL